MVNSERIEQLQAGKKQSGPVLYWMSREQRVQDNWALIFACELAKQSKEPVAVAFVLQTNFLEATRRHYDFMIKGLKEMEKSLRNLNIPFYLLTGKPQQAIPFFIEKKHISALVCDFDPLKIKQEWRNQVQVKINIPFYEVDAHNIVPCKTASNKKEFAAYTLRPKIKKKLDTFLEDFPRVKKQKAHAPLSYPENNWKAIKLDIDESIKPVKWLLPGESAAKLLLQEFLHKTINFYNAQRNDPTKKSTSNLSPYLHFGHVSAQRVAIETIKTIPSSDNTEAFLEELIVRRELSDNFCFYEKNYDNFDGFHDWAKNTLIQHKKDEREYIYKQDVFENADTHDDLWNAAQTEMVKTGKMHGYLRMYWAKKILEWTKSPEEAIAIANFLNNKYELDGLDPNGYTGCAWSIGGIHDRAWQERPVFGKIRYMNYKGCKRKFDVGAYVQITQKK
jgi:deoxyribodipyrimidine photo-lyase